MCVSENDAMLLIADDSMLLTLCVQLIYYCILLVLVADCS